MGRSNETASLGSILTDDYKASGKTVDQFIDHMVEHREAFDYRHLHEVKSTIMSVDDKYAYFHLFKNGMVLTYYYYASRDEWYCKF